MKLNSITLVKRMHKRCYKCHNKRKIVSDDTL